MVGELDLAIFPEKPYPNFLDKDTEKRRWSSLLCVSLPLSLLVLLLLLTVMRLEVPRLWCVDWN